MAIASRNVAPLLLLIFLVMIGLACGKSVTPTLNVGDIERDMDGIGTIFIWAIGNGDEPLAMSLLSARTQSAVAQYCESGEVIACFDEIEITNWGTTNDIAFLPDFSEGSTAVYGVRWSTDIPIWVVLEIVNESGDWRVDSWRGFIVSEASEGRVPYGLFDGTDATNLFPPNE